MGVGFISITRTPLVSGWVEILGVDIWIGVFSSIFTTLVCCFFLNKSNNPIVIFPFTKQLSLLKFIISVSVTEYWHWQFLSLINFIIAPALAITGIGCFYNEKN